MSEEHWDKEAVYDKQISPLMTKIIAVCKEHKMPIEGSAGWPMARKRRSDRPRVFLRDGHQEGTSDLPRPGAVAVHLLPRRRTDRDHRHDREWSCRVAGGEAVTKEADYYETVVETALASGNTGAFTDAEADAWARNGSVLDRRWAATVAKAKASSEAITAERDRARKSLRELTHWSAGTVEYDAAKRTALQVLTDAYMTPAKPLAMVPRGHCGRCDRCGWTYSANGGCAPGDCSQRPGVPLRDACAGCGAPFETTPETP